MGAVRVAAPAERQGAHAVPQAGNGRVSIQDADKQCPYYGRRLDLLANCLCKTSVNSARLGGDAPAPAGVPLPDHPAKQQGFSLSHKPTHLTPVHRGVAPSARGTCGTAPRVGKGPRNECGHFLRISLALVYALILEGPAYVGIIQYH